MKLARLRQQRLVHQLRGASDKCNRTSGLLAAICTHSGERTPSSAAMMKDFMKQPLAVHVLGDFALGLPSRGSIGT
jgi:hypothetical protein